LPFSSRCASDELALSVPGARRGARRGREAAPVLQRDGEIKLLQVRVEW